MQRFIGSFAGLAMAAALFASTEAAAQTTVIDQNKVGAALATLIVTDIEQMVHTSTIVTNTSAVDEIILAGEVISGDPEDNWTGQSFRCPMTPGESTQFVFRPTGNGSELSFECSVPGAGEFSPPSDLSQGRTIGTNARQGILWFTIEDQAAPGATLSKNVLEAKTVVLNYEAGTAFSVGAMPFQAPMPEMQDFDTNYQFNGVEYSQFPESLTASFHAPVPGEIQTVLYLFALDGTLSSQDVPNPAARIYFFNDDEEFSNGSLRFDCFAALDIDDIDSRTRRANLGSQVGHIRIIPTAVDPDDENHDGAFGDDDNSRYLGILGWIVSTINTGGEINDAGGAAVGPGMANAAAFGSNLTNSVTPLPNRPNDVPTLRR